MKFSTKAFDFIPRSVLAGFRRTFPFLYPFQTILQSFPNFYRFRSSVFSRFPTLPIIRTPGIPTLLPVNFRDIAITVSWKKTVLLSLPRRNIANRTICVRFSRLFRRFYSPPTADSRSPDANTSDQGPSVFDPRPSGRYDRAVDFSRATVSSR
jgi:hypothetical protein